MCSALTPINDSIKLGHTENFLVGANPIVFKLNVSSMKVFAYI